MFLKDKKNEDIKNQDEKVNLDDIFYLLTSIANKIGVNIEEDEDGEEEVKDIEKEMQNEAEEETLTVKEKENSEDKEKIINEVGGLLKGKVDNEIIKTIIDKIQNLSYDNLEEKKENNIVEEEQKADGEQDLEKKIKNNNSCFKGEKAFKNSIEKVKHNSIGCYVSREDRIRQANVKYSIK